MHANGPSGFLQRIAAAAAGDEVRLKASVDLTSMAPSESAAGGVSMADGMVTLSWRDGGRLHDTGEVCRSSRQAGAPTSSA